jgi:hypothetical protein
MCAAAAAQSANVLCRCVSKLARDTAHGNILRILLLAVFTTTGHQHQITLLHVE